MAGRFLSRKVSINMWNLIIWYGDPDNPCSDVMGGYANEEEATEQAEHFFSMPWMGEQVWSVEILEPAVKSIHLSADGSTVTIRDFRGERSL